jgi:MoaA/NifB/PqqE/SkfB family radical SAM enzyme
MTGKIYWLNSYETSLLSIAERNLPINDDQFFQNLKEKCLGNFSQNPQYIQKLRKGRSMNSIIGKVFELNRAFLEINNQCDLNCSYCGINGLKRSLGCLNCNKWHENDNILDINSIYHIIDDLVLLRCSDLYLTGGNLSLILNKVINILNYCQNKFKKVYITMPHSKISKDIESKIKGKATIISNLDMKTDLNNLKESDDMIYIISIYPKDINKLENIHLKNLIKSFIITKDAENSYIPFKKLFKTNIDIFLHNLEFHPCMGKTISISFSGNVTICPLMRNKVLGNIKEIPLSEIIRINKDDIHNHWKMNLDNIVGCNCCEFRYLCHDCRALEEELQDNIQNKCYKLTCSYNS